MTDRPILFSGPMVRALLEGRKTQTRRLLKPQPSRALHRCPYVNSGWSLESDHLAGGCSCEEAKGVHFDVGDHLWVRETWKPHSLYDRLPPREVPESTIFFAADNRYSPSNTRWRPGIFMPRWASRLILNVTEVRVERVQDIGRKDAEAEGLSAVTKDDGRLWKWGIPDRDGLPGTDDDGWPWDQWHPDPRQAYRRLWDSLNADRAPWASNPWVVAVTFTVDGRNTNG